MPTSLVEILHSKFGYESFREGQECVISKLLEGRSVLAIFPTGAGKSMCYQLPALLLDGITIVISPLIALMKDQVEYLRRCGIPAARLDSTLSQSEYVELFRELHSGKLKIVFISPERLSNEKFLQALVKCRISLLVIDEAHCISEWGHEFRPDYLKIALLVKAIGLKRVLALTATATPYIAGEVRTALGIAPNDEVRTDFYRPNLHLHVLPCNDSQKDRILLEHMLRRPSGPCIVYVTFRDSADELAGFLCYHGIAAASYHAGLESSVRAEIQDKFMASDDGVVVATIAFGMGIDKANIRSIYHYNMPRSMEGYCQEIGRSGRDGKKSVCVMFPSDSDAENHKNFTIGNTPRPQNLGKLTRHLLSFKGHVDVSELELSMLFHMPVTSIKTLLAYLELDGVIHSVGRIYSSYKCRLESSFSDVSQIPESSERNLLTLILKSGRHGPKWITLDVDGIAAQTGVARSEVISTITYFESLGYLIIQMKSARQRYRILEFKVSLDQIIERMNLRFRHRQKYGFARIAEIVRFTQHTGCRTEKLLNYFGQSFHPCGHCDRCLKV